MSNLPPMSRKAQEALEVLANGGRFVNRLERNSYNGREQFHRRLQRSSAWSSAIKGYGSAVFYELQGLGFLVRGQGSSVSEEYVLRKEGS